VKDESFAPWRDILEQPIREPFLVIVVDSIVNVSAIVLVLEAAVNNHRSFTSFVILAIQNVEKRLV